MRWRDSLRKGRGRSLPRSLGNAPRRSFIHWFGSFSKWFRITCNYENGQHFSTASSFCKNAATEINVKKCKTVVPTLRRKKIANSWTVWHKDVGRRRKQSDTRLLARRHTIVTRLWRVIKLGRMAALKRALRLMRKTYNFTIPVRILTHGVNNNVNV